ncbi:cyclic AMP-dependent transcription factor ATF-5-like isoform X1 [Chiroxiphia lanceolata]|uniref:cyclic AMP-dependent transcription factor ATF-5-like isoform X1 n=1 Tax=Chiroxiphia lanceolata TaxID=296741 RepID=UPI0013CEE425|nr:cyclic AMP-dependent transcription factor ATF-5-like isoform X1 [Chiroxiphia lanceolata]
MPKPGDASHAHPALVRLTVSHPPGDRSRSPPSLLPSLPLPLSIRPRFPTAHSPPPRQRGGQGRGRQSGQRQPPPFPAPYPASPGGFKPPASCRRDGSEARRKYRPLRGPAWAKCICVRGGWSRRDKMVSECSGAAPRPRQDPGYRHSLTARVGAAPEAPPQRFTRRTKMRGLRLQPGGSGAGGTGARGQRVIPGETKLPKPPALRETGWGIP